MLNPDSARNWKEDPTVMANRAACMVVSISPYAWPSSKTMFDLALSVACSHSDSKKRRKKGLTRTLYPADLMATRRIPQ